MLGDGSGREVEVRGREVEVTGGGRGVVSG
jgi:hypothetical protein